MSKRCKAIIAIQFVPKMFLYQWQKKNFKENSNFLCQKIPYSMSKRCIAIVSIQYVPKMFMYKWQFENFRREQNFLHGKSPIQYVQMAKLLYSMSKWQKPHTVCPKDV